MSQDLILFIGMIVFTSIGFIWGRWERKGSQTRTYRHGFNIGKQVGRNER